MTMPSGIQFSSGDVIFAEMYYVSGIGTKKRPAVALYEQDGNIVIAGITSNLSRPGISITVAEGMPKNSVIRPNYIFTVDRAKIFRKFFPLSDEKKQELFDEIVSHLEDLVP